jgi:plasmid replication initiation protein
MQLQNIIDLKAFGAVTTQKNQKLNCINCIKAKDKNEKISQRIRLDFESAANQNLNRLLDKPGHIYRKELF